MNSITCSVIVCTRNRCDSLQRTLESLRGLQQTAPPLTHEIIVVDNGSSDQTLAILEIERERFGVPFTVLQQPLPGQAKARNLGLANARGEIIVFTDDDVLVPHDWLSKLTRAIRAGEADAVVGGIRIAPALQRPWMDINVAGYFCDTAHFSTEGAELCLIGANMAFSKQVLAKVPNFNEALGPGALGFYDDTLFGWQLKAAGFTIAFAPEAEVEHHFDAARLSASAVREMFRKQGAALAYIARHWQGRPVRWPRLRALKQVSRRSVQQLRGRFDADRLQTAEDFWRLRLYYETPSFHWYYARLGHRLPLNGISR